MDEQNKPIIHLFSEGGYIALNSTEITNFGIEENWIFKTKKARAIFNADFAMLSIEYIKD